jgi:hypothetical protein
MEFSFFFNKKGGRKIERKEVEEEGERRGGGEIMIIRVNSLFIYALNSSCHSPVSESAGIRNDKWEKENQARNR